jgi:N-carbamoyl-L-amino-acid hydrolase
MPIRAERIQADLAALKLGAGASRRIFSVVWSDARDYIAAQLVSAGCDVRIDPAGNLHARQTAISWDAPAWLSGSHLDSGVNCGDGAIGIIATLEAFRAAREDIKIGFPLEFIAFTGSDGTVFGVDRLGSRAFAGELDAAELAELQASDRRTYVSAGVAFGVQPGELSGTKMFGNAIGFVEVHQEFGSVLWRDDIPAAIVTGIAGHRNYRCELARVPDTSPASSAFSAVAEIVIALDKIAAQLGADSIVVPSQLQCHPNAIGKVAERAVFNVHLRCARLERLAAAEQLVRRSIETAAQSRGLASRMEIIATQTAMDLDSRVAQKLHAAAEMIGESAIIQMTSPAQLDAAILAPHLPSGVIFIPNPDQTFRGEDSLAQDIAVAANILLHATRDRILA